MFLCVTFISVSYIIISLCSLAACAARQVTAVERKMSLAANVVSYWAICVPVLNLQICQHALIPYVHHERYAVKFWFEYLALNSPICNIIYECFDNIIAFMTSTIIVIYIRVISDCNLVVKQNVTKESSIMNVCAIHMKETEAKWRLFYSHSLNRTL